MASATTISKPARAARSGEFDQCVELREVGWEGYSQLLKLRGERAEPRIIYLDGTVALMSPANRHEMLSERIGWLVMEVALGLEIACTPAGQTTFRREEKRGGGEGDKSFYIAHADAIVGREELDLEIDPPPDLVVEAVHTHGPDRALEVWKRLGVPEVWTDDGEEVRFLVLGPGGEYDAAESSRAFPCLRPADVAGWSHRPPNEVGTGWVRELRRWVEQELAARVRKD